MVFVLIMNSIRELYFENAELFSAVAAAGAEYAAVAEAVEQGKPGAAAAAVERLAWGQEERLAG